MAMNADNFLADGKWQRRQEGRRAHGDLFFNLRTGERG
jgi:hypothetical protein